MATQITIQVGKKHYALDPGELLPPAGTRILAHKHLSDDGGTQLELEVTAHEWRLEEPEPDGNPAFSVTVKTRIVNA